MDDSRILTVVFTDMVASTAARVRLGEEQADRLLRVHDRLLRDRIEAHGGRVLHSQGDGLVAVFSAASEALTAAVEMQQALASYNRRRDAIAELSVRIGLSVGELSCQGDDCFGLPMAEAARLQAAARGDQILCSELVRLMARGRGGHRVRPIGFLELKGLPEPLPTCEVLWEPDPDRPPFPLPSELEVEAGRPFVGRTAELASAGELIAGERQDRLAVLWLLGEPGIGKTRLAAEIARRAHAAGAVVLFGRCSEDIAVPYQPFLEALQWHVAHLPDVELGDRLGEAPGELMRLVPGIASRLPAHEPPRPAGPEIEQHRLFEAVRTWLASAGGGRDVVVVLDDVQWAVRPTLALLAHVTRSAEPSRALLVCPARTTSPDDNEALDALIEDLRRRGAPSRRVELTGLDVKAVGALVEAAAGRPLDERSSAFAAKLQSETAGNPLYVDAVLSGSHSFDEEPASRLPETLAATVAGRLARLPPEVGDLLRTASVAGLDFRLGVVARAAGRDEPAALDSIERACRAGLVDEEGVDRYRFRHALVRSALRERLSDSRRVRLHLRVAEALEAAPGDRDEQVTALAFHFTEAIPAGAAAKAYRYTVLAAERATRLLSHHQAADAYGHALAILDRMDDAPASARYGTLMARSDALRRAGDVVGALQTLRAAAGEAAARGGSEDIATAAVRFENTSFWLGRPGTDALELLERAEAALPAGDSPLRALTLAGIARARDTSGRGRGDGRGEEAMAIARRLDDPATLFAVEVRTTRSSVSVAKADVSAARWMDLCPRAREVGDDESLLFALGQAMWARVMLGDREGAEELFGEYAHLAPPLRQPAWQYWSDVFRALLSILAADLEAAEGLLERADRVGRELGWASEGLYGLAMFLIRREQDRLAEVVPLVRAAVGRSPGPSLWRPGLAALYAGSGHLDDAAQILASVVSEGPAAFPTDGTRELCLALLSEVCAAVGDAEQARWLLRQLGPCRERFLVFFGSAAGLGPTDRLLGMLASTAGRDEQAEAWHAQALAMARRMRSPLWTAHCLYDYAVHVEGSDPPAAERMLSEAAAVCEARRLTALGRQVERRLQS